MIKTKPMMRIFIFFFLVCILSACGNEPSSATQEKTPPATEAPKTQPAPTAAATMPSIPLELLQSIWTKGTQIDYIYHYHPFTASISDKPAIQNAVRHVAETPAPLNPNCKPAGLITYQIDGDIVLRADFYFEANCTYFVFYDQDKNKYSNYMTQEGVNFFNSQIQQATQLSKQNQ